MKYITVLFLFIIVIGCEVKPEESYNPAIIAYYVPEKDYTPENIPLDKLTHIIFSFTHVIDGQMKFRNPDFQSKRLRQLVEQKSRNPELKVMIACGGWGADGFSDLALTAESRSMFVQSVTEFIDEYKLDGLDIDWEYPSISGAGTVARPEDKRNFTLLMQELRAALDKLNMPQTLTFASAGWKPYYDNIELEAVMNVADYMNIMTYDLVTGVSIFTGHHTPLGAVSSNNIKGTPMAENLDSISRSERELGRNVDSDPNSIESIVKYLIAQGVSPNQMVIGAAFYGRAWKGVPPERNGLYQLSSGIHIGWATYRFIREHYESDSSFQRHWDEEAKAPYLYNKMDSIMLSYDDTVSVRLKMEYAVKNKLGGIMFWELGYDTKEGAGLLDAIYSAEN